MKVTNKEMLNKARRTVKKMELQMETKSKKKKEKREK